MSTTVLLTGDTHLPRFGRILPQQLLEAARDAELILHAGDLTDDRRRQPEFSFVRLVIEGDRLEPELVTYPRWR